MLVLRDKGPPDWSPFIMISLVIQEPPPQNFSDGQLVAVLRHCSHGLWGSQAIWVQQLTHKVGCLIQNVWFFQMHQAVSSNRVAGRSSWGHIYLVTRRPINYCNKLMVMVMDIDRAQSQTDWSTIHQRSPRSWIQWPWTDHHSPSSTKTNYLYIDKLMNYGPSLNNQFGFIDHHQTIIKWSVQLQWPVLDHH